MKIEVKIEQRTGGIKHYPVHKLVKHGEIWTAHYTTVKAGFHVSRKINIDNVIAELEVEK